VLPFSNLSPEKEQEYFCDGLSEELINLWSGQFDREMKDIFDIQEEISLTIVDHLKLKLLKDEKEKILERLDGLSKDRYVGSFSKALVWLGLGEKNKALENLENAYLERESLMATLKVWPLFDSLRPEPRFQALLKKMNLE
jgi:hypothetical protein